jgi:3'-phosphoadenosine 5'-phosphosulfate sulfotransferase (PAPS reductase)/FAD synthetase
MIDLSPLDRHERIALCASGGKDSLAVVYLLRPYLHRLQVYHLDTGDLLPEVMEIARHVEAMAPNFVRVQTDAMGWIAKHGLPTDLMPHSAHPIGRAMGEDRIALVPRYECCWANLMQPLWDRIRADGNTLLIRGTKRIDMKRLPVPGGGNDSGVEFWLPIEDWSNADVFAYLRSVGAPICRVYDTVTNSPECARCSAWWGERRAEYLRQHHPELWRDYSRRMRAVLAELWSPLQALNHEIGGVE